MHLLTQPRLEPDLVTAQAFLDALEPGGKFCFQAYDDCANKRKVLSRILVGTLSSYAETLYRLNEAGAAITVMVNDGTSRKDADVTRIRANFVDLDHAPIEPVLQGPKLPQIVVQTSPGRHHAYWLTSDCPVEQFKARQQWLAGHFNGDPSVCNPARVMRLPGFFHMKTGIPFRTELTSAPGWVNSK